MKMATKGSPKSEASEWFPFTPKRMPTLKKTSHMRDNREAWLSGKGTDVYNDQRNMASLGVDSGA